MKLTPEKKVVTGFACALVLLLAVGVAGWHSTVQLRNDAILARTTQEVLTRLNSLLAAVNDVALAQRGYIITGDEAFLPPQQQGERDAAVELAELRGLLAGNIDQLHRLDALRLLVEERIARCHHIIKLRRTEGFETTRRETATGKGKEIHDAIRRAEEEMERTEIGLLRDREAITARTTRQALAVIVGGSLLSVLLMCASLWVLRLYLAARLRAEAEVRTLNTELEQRVRDRTAQLEAANKELEAFSYSVSHDLRAPLRHVQGYVDMLAREAGDQLSDKSRRYMQTITDASHEMGVLIDELLAFSRMGRGEMIETRVNLDALVQDTLRDLEPTTRGRNIVWKIQLLPAVQADPAMLKLALANLLGNAIKFTRPRTPAQIEIGCDGLEGGRVIVFVRDNGVGFDPQYAHKLFGVFQRLHRTEEFEGTGIGLANVRRIIARHGGRTWAEGQLNEGATFYFTLKPSTATDPAVGKENKS